ncbi:MAG: SiaB family protein kinase [Bacteroidales bacterium]|jgi:hypothetical protein|nr:SiaB family protein kinase [Bacteroidales bacterium]
MKADIHNLFLKGKNGNLVEAFEGDITHDLISIFLDKVETSLLRMGESLKVTRKLYNILVEALQNLFHHLEIPPAEYLKSLKLPEKCRYGFCTVVKDGAGVYKIISGNFIKNDSVQFLRDRIEQLNYLSSDELKELYKRILNNDEFSEKGGGGLGFIEMARKSQNKFGYDFVKYDEHFSFFVLEVLVK